VKKQQMAKQAKRDELRARALTSMDDLPSVYRRLWDDVEVKSKKQ